MKALLHVHSDYSYDGVPSLEELAIWGEARGLDIIFLTEHTNDFDTAKMERFVRHCDSLAGRRCRLVPGLEFAVRGGFHVLGYDLRRFEPVSDPAAVIAWIRENGGMAVLAHPARYRGAWPSADEMAGLDGIEVWSARYDGRFLPPGDLIVQVASEWPSRRPLLRLGGQDLHETTHRRLVTTTSREANRIEEFVAALRTGDVRFGAAPFSLTARGRVSIPWARALGALHAGYRAARRARDRWSARREASPKEGR